MNTFSGMPSLYVVFLSCRINEVRWDGQNIIVMDQVTIHPPYSLDDCKSSSSTKALNALSHVKKLVSATSIHMIKNSQCNKKRVMCNYVFFCCFFLGREIL